MEGTEERCFESDFPPGSDMMGDLILTYIMGRENSECLLLDTQCEHGICDGPHISLLSTLSIIPHRLIQG